jgi:hypothetical protein
MVPHVKAEAFYCGFITELEAYCCIAPTGNFPSYSESILCLIAELTLLEAKSKACFYQHRAVIKQML